MKTKGGTFLVQQTEKIFTPENFSEEQIMMRDAAIEFIDREVWPNKNRFEQKDYQFTEKIMREIGAMGFLGVSIPEQYGGMDMGFTSTMLVCDRLSGSSGSLATAFGAHTGIGTMPIALYGNEKQKETYLNKIITGEWFCSYCLTEPNAGSDANSGKTKAELSADGSHYVINGQKMWISNAGFANVLIVFARIEDDKNITAFIVENDPSNGITMGEEEHKLGIRASSTRQVFFNNTKVPVENMLSERGNGFKIALNVLNIGRIKLAIASVDGQRRVLEGAVKYANERIQFKQPIANFEAIQFKLAEMATQIFNSETAGYRVGYLIEEAINQNREAGMNHADAERVAFEEFAVECAMLKVYNSEAMQYVSDEGIQILGGMGFSEETPMESAWRDARIGRIYEGTNEINRMLSVGMLVKKAMKGDIDLLSPATAVANSLLEIPSFDVPDYSEILSEEKALVENLKKVVLMIAGKAVQKYMAALDQQQFLLSDLSDMLIQTFVVESTVLRALQNQNSGLEQKHKDFQLAIAQLALHTVIEKVSTAARNAIYSISEDTEQKALLMGLKRFTKYTNIPNPYQLRKKIAEFIISEGKYPY